MMIGHYLVAVLVICHCAIALPLDLVFSQWDSTVGRCPSLYGSSEKPGLLGTFEKLKSTCSGKTGPLCAAVLGISIGVCEIHQQKHDGDIQTDKIKLPELPQEAGPEEICQAMIEPHLQTRLKYHITNNAIYQAFKNKLSGFLAVNNTKSQCVERCSEPEVEGMDPDNLGDGDRVYLCKTALKGLQSLAAILGPTPEEERSMGERPGNEESSNVKEEKEEAAPAVNPEDVKKNIEKFMKNPAISASLKKSPALAKVGDTVLKFVQDEDDPAGVVPAIKREENAAPDTEHLMDSKNPLETPLKEKNPAEVSLKEEEPLAEDLKDNEDLKERQPAEELQKDDKTAVEKNVGDSEAVDGSQKGIESVVDESLTNEKGAQPKMEEMKEAKLSENIVMDDQEEEMAQQAVDNTKAKNEVAKEQPVEAEPRMVPDAKDASAQNDSVVLPKVPDGVSNQTKVTTKSNVARNNSATEAPLPAPVHVTPTPANSTKNTTLPVKVVTSKVPEGGDDAGDKVLQMPKMEEDEKKGDAAEEPLTEAGETSTVTGVDVDLKDSALIPGDEEDEKLDEERGENLDEEVDKQLENQEYEDRNGGGGGTPERFEQTRHKYDSSPTHYYEENAEESNFMTMLLTFVALTLLGYLAFHNKHRIIAVMIEGRRRRPAPRGRFANTSYKKLDSSFDETLSSSSRVNRSDVIY